MWRGQSGRGFTLIEALVGMLFVLAAGMLLPAFAQDLITGDVLWERRLAVAFIETTLDQACTQARTEAGFDGIGPEANSVVGIPARLSGGTWSLTVECPNGDTLVNGVCDATANLKRLHVTVNWLSRGHQITQPSADYFISQTGVCGG